MAMFLLAWQILLRILRTRPTTVELKVIYAVKAPKATSFLAISMASLFHFSQNPLKDSKWFDEASMVQMAKLTTKRWSENAQGSQNSILEA